MAGSGRWDDLRPRVITGGLLIAVGISVIVAGGIVFALTAAIVTGIMVWELARMLADDRKSEAIQLAVLTTACLLLARAMPPVYAIPTLILPVFAGVYLLRTRIPLLIVYILGIVVAGFGLTLFRDIHGMLWLFWLVIVVASTDIAGYFAGKAIGGPKFWPRISPKKTWAGIISGWIVAGLIGLVFWNISSAGRDLIWISMLLSFASQMGDIAQSAIKRIVGVKDASNLLPGHGGLFDRFDGLLGASLFLLFVALVVDVPVLRL